MRLINTGIDSFNGDAAEFVEELQQQRSDFLGMLTALHAGARNLIALEADRLAAKRGDADPRVQILRDRADATVERVSALSVEDEIASVRTAAPPAAGLVIQGRIVDDTQRATPRVMVQLVDSNGKAVRRVDPVEADDVGYYAFTLTPDTVRAVGTTNLTIAVVEQGNQIIPASARPFTLTGGVVPVQSVGLNSGELEKLQLRIPVSVTPTPATGKAAAGKAAADKAAVSKPAPKSRSATKKPAPDTNPAKPRGGSSGRGKP